MDDRRNKPVSFTVTSAELERIERAASIEGISKADVCRRATLRDLAQRVSAPPSGAA